jgi:3-hydroxy-9,10-secoandrosta-1,3,5(10)-triene-9,17-dione monooxygenase
VTASALNKPAPRNSDEIRHVARAAELYAELSARAGETIAARKLLDSNVKLVKAAGLFKTLQPRRCGGYEYSLHTHIDVIEEVSRGCGSTGWVLGVMQAHSWVVGLYGEQAQADIYGENPDARISAVIAPRGSAKKTDGGFILNGFWPFCSGCHHADWLLLGEMVHGNDGGEPIDSGVMLVPANDAQIQDDWYTGGLTGTGSNSVAVKDLFVPEHRFLSVPAAIESAAPGCGLHQSNLYYSAAVPVLTLFIATPALGMARRALEQFKERLPGKIVTYTFGEKQLDMPTTHMEIAEAATKLDAARTLLHASVDEIEDYAQRREPMPFARRAKARMDMAFAVRLCMESTEILYLATGGSGLAEKSAIYQAQKDLHAVNMHGLLCLKTNLEMYGRVLLGLPPNSPVI